MNTLVNVIIVVLVAFAVLVAFGSGVGTVEFVLWLLLTAGAIYLVVRNGRRKRTTT